MPPMKNLFRSQSGGKQSCALELAAAQSNDVQDHALRKLCSLGTFVSTCMVNAADGGQRNTINSTILDF